MTPSKYALNVFASTYQNGVSDASLLDPTTWTLDQALMDRPGNADIQLDMLLDYATNVPLYPDFQAFFRKYQPPMLIVWGKNDFIFPPKALPRINAIFRTSKRTCSTPVTSLWRLTGKKSPIASRSSLQLPYSYRPTAEGLSKAVGRCYSHTFHKPR